MKKIYTLTKLLVIIISVSNFSCAKKVVSSQIEQNISPEQIQTSNIENNESENNNSLVNSNNIVSTDANYEPSPAPSITTEETLKLLEPTEIELNNKVSNENQFTDIYAQ